MKLMKKIYILLIFFLLFGLFYWFQWRPSEIRKQCFKEVYSENINLEWAEGKEWMYYESGKFGWLYPYWRLQSKADTFKGCLLFRGLR